MIKVRRAAGGTLGAETAAVNSAKRTPYRLRLPSSAPPGHWWLAVGFRPDARAAGGDGAENRKWRPMGHSPRCIARHRPYAVFKGQRIIGRVLRMVGVPLLTGGSSHAACTGSSNT